MRRAAAVTVALTSGLALAVASSAPASHSTHVNTQSVTLGSGGSVVVSGTIACTDGYTYFGTSTVRQRSGRQYNTAMNFFSGTCSTTGPASYTTAPTFGSGPFHPGPASVQSTVVVCQGFFVHCASAQEVRDIQIEAARQISSV